MTDYKNHEELLKDAILSLLKPKYSGYNVYIHNLSNFDGIFLLKTLAELLDSEKYKISVTPVLRDGSFISIKIKFDKYSISFRDSYLLLPISLRELSSQFKVEHPKTIFPHNFLNDKFNPNLKSQNDLNYVGPVPALNYFGDLSTNENVKSIVENYSNFLEGYLKSADEGPEIVNKFNNWSLKKESIKYCLQDCVSLYEVLEKFNEQIFIKFKKNIHGTPTLPSLTFAIFRSNYLKDLNKSGYYIPLIEGPMYKQLKLSYTGGSLDMYHPSNTGINGLRHKVYCYDINSIFPYCMTEEVTMSVISNKMKYVTYFEGDVSLLPNSFKDPFGFYNSIVETTTPLEHPILQLKHKTKNGAVRTISPLGKWDFMYFSKELENAEKYGYKVSIKSGYLFDEYPVFGSVIKDLYAIKEAHNKDDPWYTISKLLMNSIYGRLGMSIEQENHSIVISNELDSYISNYDVIDVKTLTMDKILISYKAKEMLLDSDSKNVSISVASAITAYARIVMSQFKNNPNYRVLYSDTDSIHTDHPIDPKYIGSKIGQFKLENIYDEAVYIAPKVYGGILEDGTQLTKVKGFKNTISYAELKELLNKNHKLKLNHKAHCATNGLKVLKIRT